MHPRAIIATCLPLQYLQTRSAEQHGLNGQKEA
jgi:hypothetical protein